MVTTRGMAARMAMEDQAPAGHTVQQQPENPRRSRVKRKKHSEEQEQQVYSPAVETVTQLGPLKTEDPPRKRPQFTHSERGRVMDPSPSSIVKEESPSDDGKVRVDSEGDTSSALREFDPLTQAGDDATSYLIASAAADLRSFVVQMGNMISGSPIVPSVTDASRTAGGTVTRTSGERTDYISGQSLKGSGITGRRSRRSARLSKQEPNQQ